MSEKPKALVISGLGDNRPNQIISDIEEMGYQVEYITYHDPDFSYEDLSLVVGHSAGAARAVTQYAGTDIPVFALSSPARSGVFRDDSNVVYSQNAVDPVGIVGSLLSGDFNPFNNQGTFLSLSGNPHDKNEAWDHVKNKVKSFNTMAVNDQSEDRPGMFNEDE